MHSPVLSQDYHQPSASDPAPLQSTRESSTESDLVGPSRIDMLTPYQACTNLGIGPAALLALVNSGALPAYQFESAVRFRTCEVDALDLPAAA